MLRYLTSGESHGIGLMAIIDGVPAGLKLKEEFINKELARRMVGYGRGGRMKIEKDKVNIISGIKKGVTIGSPVGMIIYNRDFKIDKLPDVFCPRPGHADLAGLIKYNFCEARSVLERASARETAAKVAAGAVAKMILSELNIDVFSHVIMLGGIKADVSGLSYEKIIKQAEQSDLRTADKEAAKIMRAKIDEASKKGDTLGGVFEVISRRVPPGLGSYTQWDKRIDGAIARAIMSIPAVKAVSLGDGIEAAGKYGSAVHDEIFYDKKSRSFLRGSNKAGGIEGGMTNGSPIVVKGYMKPIATLSKPLRTVNINSKKEAKASTERADVTAVAACGVIAEAAVAIEIASKLTEKFGGDSILEMKRNLKGYLAAIRKI